ncbi:MAG: thiamine pyrophosphate-dependent enzyme [Candidatus Kariarchaeaceae archaeon]|jgi:2-oxoglutarate ferredoxin oxidoreductase subunit beta
MSSKTKETELPFKKIGLPILIEQHQKINWCSGCGDYALLKATKRALSRLGFEPKDVVIVSGIGCSSNFPHFTAAYGFHAVHGRALPVATGIHLSNPDLKTIVVGGDGDGFGIGLSHFIHAARRNLNIIYTVMNNQIYGLTLGQASPSSSIGHQTKITPDGVDERPINPITLALSGGATFVARGFSGEVKHLEDLIIEAINHKGFSFIDVLSPCVTFNKINTYKFFKDRVYNLQDENHDSSNLADALARGLDWNDQIPIGIFYQNKSQAPLHEIIPGTTFGTPVNSPLGFKNMNISPDKVFDEFR